MAKKKTERTLTDDPRYHDTWKLLKKYRDVVWSLELSVLQVKKQFRVEYECSIEDFLDSIYLAGADLNGTEIEAHAKCIERSHKMLTLLENAVDLLRTRHKKGEIYYWLLYYTYLSPQKLKNVEEIIESLRPHIRDISFSTYYRLRKEAVEALSSVLWGYSSQSTLDALEQFFPAESQEGS
jgi:hypothetical protein